MLGLMSWLLVVAASLLTVLLIMINVLSRKRRPGEPEIVKGRLIWGSCIDFSTDAVAFLHRTYRRYGQCFTLRLINQYLTVVMDPHSYEKLVKTTSFDFDPIHKQVTNNVFGFTIKESRKFIKDSSKTMRGPYLIKGIQSFTKKLDQSFERLRQQTTAKPTITNNKLESGVPRLITPDMSDHYDQDGLRAFCSKTMFDAIFNNLFGEDSTHHAFNSQLAYKNFDIFHKYFNFLWLGLPKKLFPKALGAVKELLVMPDAEELLARDDLNSYLRTAISYLKENGQTEGDIKGHNLVFLHVNYNTFRLAFWVLSYIMEEQKAYSALQKEMDDAVDERLNPDTNTAVFTIKDLEGFKVLDSIIQESIRLSCGVFLIRYINEDTQFSTSDGTTHLMRQGDRVALYPPAFHKDPEIFKNPEEFQYDRFIDASFTKDGQELMHPIMAFGSLCPGKRYALIQLKWYLLTVLTRFRLQLVEGEHAQFAYEYHGHEILPPKKDVQMQFQHKTDVANLELND